MSEAEENTREETGKYGEDEEGEEKPNVTNVQSLVQVPAKATVFMDSAKPATFYFHVAAVATNFRLVEGGMECSQIASAQSQCHVYACFDAKICSSSSGEFVTLSHALPPAASLLLGCMLLTRKE
ncbi:hypothetical protein EGR_09302 [Echinococcus granulosus]|uniref:Uncharacterized protein n=1 Tax=Echinococcus granulosus TaxID=6210 RepID=W6U3Z2_ECHGR|nr:hypothetical protein EGR_09302 [Echinococcus granulosus]EUB55828.1 hypothetical protein EGR_09302 [Echinococcus granulosus]